MSGVPLAVSGPVTVALIVVLGIFIYPWLLQRRGGALAVAALTLLLIALFVTFERGGDHGYGNAGIAVAALLGCAPAFTTWIVRRLQRASGANKSGTQ